jgi:hypothetical protein
MGGLFGGGSSSPPPQPKKSGDAITVTPGPTSNQVAEAQKQATAGAVAETSKKTTGLGDEMSDTVLGSTKTYG